MTLNNYQDLQNKPVCIVGNLCVDLIIRNVPAIPVWGQEVNGTSHLLVSSGQTGYTAFALSRLGISTCVISSVGDDLNGRQVIEDLRTYGIDASGVTVLTDGQTGITVAIVRKDGERAFVSTLGSSQDFNETMVLNNWGKLTAASIVCLVGLFAIPNLTLNAATRILGKAKLMGKVTMLDTGWDPHNWQSNTIKDLQQLLHEVTIFMPNIDEARAITGKNTPEETMLELQRFGPEIIVVKCGDEGSYCRHGDSTYFVPPRKVQVLDAVGAGDTFNAGFLYGFRLGWSYDTCMIFGNTIASMYISRATDRWPGLEEVTATAKISYPFMLEN